MTSYESMPSKETDPRLLPILEKYGEVLVLNHEDQPQPLYQAIDECPPFGSVLLNAESPEMLEQIVESLKAPE